MTFTFLKSKPFIVFNLISIAIMFILFYKNVMILKKKEQLSDDTYKIYKVANHLKQTSDDLTNFARSYITTKNPIFKKQYKETLDIRNGVIARPIESTGIYWDLPVEERDLRHPKIEKKSLQSMIASLPFTKKELDLLNQAESRSNILAQIETQAFLIFETLGDQKKALDMLYSLDYHRHKAQIMLPIDIFIHTIDERLQDEIDTLNNQDMIFQFLLYSVVLIFMVINFVMISFFKKEISEKSELLEKNLKRLEKIQRFSLTGYFSIDKLKNQHYFSSELKRIFGLGENDHFNKEIWFQMIHEDDKEEVSQIIEDIFKLNNSIVRHLEYRIISTTNNIKWIDENWKCIENESGEIIAIEGYIQDITARKISQEKEKERDRLYFKQQKLVQLGEMIGNIVHQWRQPLNLISLTATEALLKKSLGKLNSNHVEEGFKSIITQVEYLSGIINTFRNFAKGNTYKRYTNVYETIETALGILDPALKMNNINSHLDIQTKTIEIEMVPEELIEVIINIINNAKDEYIKKDLEIRDIWISLHHFEDKCIIRIKDNAGGIPNSVLSHIFEPYFTTKEQDEGTGLGLSMSYKMIAESFHGKLSAHNYENGTTKGAIFTIEIPLNKKAIEE